MNGTTIGATYASRLGIRLPRSHIPHQVSMFVGFHLVCDLDASPHTATQRVKIEEFRVNLVLETDNCFIGLLFSRTLYCGRPSNGVFSAVRPHTKTST